MFAVDYTGFNNSWSGDLRKEKGRGGRDKLAGRYLHEINPKYSSTEKLVPVPDPSNIHWQDLRLKNKKL